MATLINSIAFQNFYNYYGNYEQNTYVFKSGINIINADNNMGKSKFYNGLLWLLNNQVYDSDLKALTDADESLEKMASGKAKNERTDFTIGVKVVFTKEKTIYTLEKTCNFFYINDQLTHGDTNLEINKNENNCDITVVDIQEKQDIIDRDFIPQAIRPYALLQGESMDRLVDLSSKKALSQTIDILAGISILKNVCDLSSKLANRAEKLYQLKDSQNSKNNKQKQELLSKRTNLREQKKKIEELKEIAESERNAAKDRKEELDAYISNSSKRNEIRSNLSRINNKLESLIKEKNYLEKSITSMIFDEDNPWILMDLEDELEKFNQKREKHIGDLAKLNDTGALVIMLPEGSPDTSSLERMLRTGICEVCGQAAPKGSEPWKHIKMVLERPQKISTTRNDFGQFYGNLQKAASSYSMSIPKIHGKINAIKDKIDNISDEIDKYTEKRNEIFTELNNAGGNSDNSEIEDKKLIGDYETATSTITKKEHDIDIFKKQLELITNSLDSIDDKISIFQKDSETEKYEMFEQKIKSIASIIKDTQNEIFDRTIRHLEEEANEKYQALTKGNQSSGGRLSFKKENDTVFVAIRDVQNGLITGLGTGFQRMKQLAIVMAIISSKIGEEKKFDYPFISDAPFSEFGENFITNFFNVSPGVFTQSIIMIKELYDPNSPDYLTPFGRKIKDKMVSGEIPGTFYVNIIENKADTTALVTSHKCYKS